jgi:hypothetical protein
VKIITTFFVSISLLPIRKSVEVNRKMIYLNFKVLFNIIFRYWGILHGIFNPVIQPKNANRKVNIIVKSINSLFRLG